MKQGWRYNVLKETVLYITKYEGILAEGNDPLSFFCLFHSLSCGLTERTKIFNCTILTMMVDVKIDICLIRVLLSTVCPLPDHTGEWNLDTEKCFVTPEYHNGIPPGTDRCRSRWSIRKNAIKNCYRVLIVMLNSISATEQWAIYSYYLLFFTLNFTSLASICYVYF